MPLELHDKLKQHIKQKLQTVLSKIIVDNDIFLSNISSLFIYTLDNSLPKTGNLPKELEKYIGSDALSSFTQSFLLRKLINNNYNADETNKQLVDFDGFSNLENVSDEILEEFSNLPYKYSVCIKIPGLTSSIFESDENEISLSPTVDIIKPTSTYISEHPLSTGDSIADQRLWRTGLLSFDSDKEMDRNNAYLKIQCTGFIDLYSHTMTFLNTINKIKTFLGLLLSYDVLKKQYSYNVFNGSPKILIHKYKNNSWRFENVFDTNLTTLKNITSISLNKNNGSSNSFSQIIPILQKLFSDDLSNSKIQLACSWLYDGYLSDDDLLAFIQLTTCIEILLGDKKTTDILGITELLSNRCSYLICNSSKERDQLIQDFKKLYDVRSKIVHRGKHFLKAEDKTMFYKLKDMCKKVILKELELLS